MTSHTQIAMFYFRKKPKKVDDQYTEQTYVKKPLNAFMLFSKEHRQAVKDRSASTNIAVINETLGKMVSDSNVRTTYTHTHTRTQYQNIKK